MINEPVDPLLLKSKILPKYKIMFVELLKLDDQAPLSGKNSSDLQQLRFPYILNCPSKRLLSYVSLACEDDQCSGYSSDKVLARCIDHLLQESDSKNFELPISRLKEKYLDMQRMTISCIEPVVGRIEEVKKFIMPFAANQKIFNEFSQEFATLDEHEEMLNDL